MSVVCLCGHSDCDCTEFRVDRLEAEGFHDGYESRRADAPLTPDVDSRIPSGHSASGDLSHPDDPDVRPASGPLGGVVPGDPAMATRAIRDRHRCPTGIVSGLTIWRGICGHLWDRADEDTDECPRCATEAAYVQMEVARDAVASELRLAVLELTPNECPANPDKKHVTYGGICHCGWTDR